MFYLHRVGKASRKGVLALLKKDGVHALKVGVHEVLPLVEGESRVVDSHDVEQSKILHDSQVSGFLKVDHCDVSVQHIEDNLRHRSVVRV